VTPWSNPKLRRAGFALLVLCVALLCAPAARAGSPYLVVPDREALEASPAYRYGNMSAEQAYAELDRRGVPYRRVGMVHGVQAPIRLTGALRGVHIHSALPPEQRASSVFEILDARLALALDDFAQILARHDIVEVVHYTMYRPNLPMPGTKQAGKGKGKGKGSKKSRATKSPDKRDPKGGRSKVRPKGSGKSKGKEAGRKPAKKPTKSAKRRGNEQPSPYAGKKWAPPGTRHPAGLAIDVATLIKRDGGRLSVAQHFQGRIGERTCGPYARKPRSEAARELRAIVCEASEQGIFTYILTPNYDRPHADHFHMEVNGRVHWFVVH